MARKWDDLNKIRIADASEYDLGEGFVIEQCCFSNSYIDDDLIWALPAWEERGVGHLAGVFPTREAAAAAIAA